MNAQQYADRIGVSKMRVSQYIKEGRISAVRVGRSYEIDPELADQQLKGSVSQRNGQAKSAPAKAAAASPPPAPPPTRTLIPSAGGKNSQSQALMKGGPTMAEAQRAREVYRAERERLALLREKEELLPAEAVKKEAFNLAKTIREALLNIPDRVANQFAAETDPQAVHLLLTGEISQALEQLANG